MTISLAWVRRKKDVFELVVASDSRLRSRGSLDQAQKILRLERGDCALSFCGDAQFAYPMFMQAGSTLNNFIKTRTRATDLSDVPNLVGLVLNALVESWDLPNRDKQEELKETRIVLSGWSWRLQNFIIGVFEYKNDRFAFKKLRTKLPHPWYPIQPFLFVGDYKDQYLGELCSVLCMKYGPPETQRQRFDIDLDYEPIIALKNLLARSDAGSGLHKIGGAPQMLKTYQFSQSLPFVVKISGTAHYLFGRRMFEWEKTEYPIIDLTESEPSFLYPMSEIPLPSNLQDRSDRDRTTEVPSS